MRGLTSEDKKEINDCLNLLIKSSNDINYLHEYFDINDLNFYVNVSFPYANSFFCVFIDHILEKFPDILANLK